MAHDKVPTPREWLKVSKSKVVSIHHYHDLPLCGSGYHDKECAKHGLEISCVKVLKGFGPKNKPIYGASCVHLFT